jgi:hypothetical protein
MKQQNQLLACLFFGLTLSSTGFSQTPSDDSSSFVLSRKSVIDFYMTSMGKRTYLYNGSEYIFNSHGINGHPFFESDHLINSRIEYDGTTYYDIPLAYDLVQDRVFITDSSINFNIQLFNERVSSFMMAGHQFVRIQADSGKSKISNAGFYDLLYDGKIKVLAKRTKVAENGFKLEDPMRFVSYNAYYLWMDNNYIEVDSKSSLVKAFKDQKDLIRKYYRKNGLDFKKNPEQAIVSTTDYYLKIKSKP